MKRKRFSVEQIVAIVKQAEMGMPVAELIRRVGISEQTFYRWKKQFTGLEIDQVRQLKQLQDENGRLKKLVAELTLDRAMLQDVLRKKLVKPSCRRAVVTYLCGGYRGSERRACKVVLLPRARSVPEHSRSADRAADASAGVGASADSIRLSQAAGAADSGRMASAQEVGLSSVPRGEAGIAKAAEGTANGARSTAGRSRGRNGRTRSGAWISWPINSVTAGGSLSPRLLR